MELNIAHTEYPQQQGGLMICGYEWGYSKEDQAKDENGVVHVFKKDAGCTFANKEICYGPDALKWRYDNTVKKWFEMWGHPLQNLPGDFEMSIIQTNWCNTQDHSLNGDYSKLLDQEQVDNFIYHIEYFKPLVILFMGSQLIKALQNPKVIKRFEIICGKSVGNSETVQKPFSGRRFEIVFQNFETCNVVCFPHPSSARGLSDTYIESFRDRMDKILQNYKLSKFGGFNFEVQH